jgi:hypothetical protein
MTDGLHEATAEEVERALIAYRATLKPAILPRSAVQAAIALLLNLDLIDGRDGKRDGRRKRMIALFDGAASWGTIRTWCRGTHQPPPCIREFLIAKLLARAREFHAAAIRLRDLPVFDPIAGAAHLTPARRAKEKARVAARASGQTESD